MSSNRPMKGLPGSPGRASGPAYRWAPGVTIGRSISQPLSGDEVAAELARFTRAVQSAREEIESTLAQTEGEAAGVLEVHLLMLADPLLVDATLDRIRNEGVAAETALATTVAEIASSLRSLTDDYLRERAADVEDVGGRLQRLLSQSGPASGESSFAPGPGCIVVARDLTPSEVLAAHQAGVAGLAMSEGSATSHAVILARSLRLPAVVAVAGLMENVAGGDQLTIDGERGEVSAGLRRAASEPARTSHHRERTRPRATECRTADGRRIRIYANLSRPEELEAALAADAEGIGVLRTEFLFLESPASEEQQYETYRALAERLEGKPLVVRTLDVGGDKALPYLPLPAEANPFLGRRGLRLSLMHLDLFGSQLRAILRASAHGCIRVMFPMVTDISELVRAQALLAQARSELLSEGQCLGKVEVGAMIEVPAAALCADRLAREAAFLSIGTNDLAQYTLAADRSSPTVAALYSQTHLAVLRLLKLTVEGGHWHNRPVAVCGEMAADLEALPLLVGLGVDELSMAPYAISEVRETLADISYAEAAARVSALLARS